MLLCAARRLPHVRAAQRYSISPTNPRHGDALRSKSHMPVTLQRSLAIPAQALAWLGGQGTRAIAALVFIGIAVPPIGQLLKPFVTEAIFLLLCISFMRVDIGALRDHLRRPGIVLAATAWTTLGVPLIMGVSCLATGLDVRSPGLFLALMLQAVGSPVGRAPAPPPGGAAGVLA